MHAAAIIEQLRSGRTRSIDWLTSSGREVHGRLLRFASCRNGLRLTIDTGRPTPVSVVWHVPPDVANLVLRESSLIC